MKTTDNVLLITSAPPEILLGLGLFVCVAALLLLLLSMEAGNYPNILRIVRRARANILRCRRKRHRWLFIPSVSVSRA